MVTRIHALGVHAFKVLPVTVEVHLIPGQYGMQILGLPDAALRESRERIRSAIVNSGFLFPVKQIIVNLIPADIAKEGAQLELAIAAAILQASGQIEPEIPDKAVFLGSLSLSGKTLSVGNLLASLIYAARIQSNPVIIPGEISAKADEVPDLEYIPLTNLSELRELTPKKLLRSHPKKQDSSPAYETNTFDHIYGLNREKRALALALTGKHHILLMGEPGTGKSALLNSAPALLPALTTRESLETSEYYSLAESHSEIIRFPPIRRPHHTASQIAIIGGGSRPRPGEITLAHNGILFLDELIEFNSSVLQTLREPMEKKTVHISRIREQVDYAANFTLLAASNPCRCGNLFSRGKRCTCSPATRFHGLRKIIGPFLDRIAIEVDLQKKIENEKSEQPHEWYREKIAKTRTFRGERGQSKENSTLNMGELLENIEPLLQPSRIQNFARKLDLSQRGILSSLQVARTIADWEEKEKIGERCLAEAFSYRGIRLLANSYLKEMAS